MSGEVVGEPVAGELEVGTDGRGSVVVNLPRDMTGHIAFSPDQASRFAELLNRHATVAAIERLGTRRVTG